MISQVQTRPCWAWALEAKTASSSSSSSSRQNSSSSSSIAHHVDKQTRHQSSRRVCAASSNSYGVAAQQPASSQNGNYRSQALSTIQRALLQQPAADQHGLLAGGNTSPWSSADSRSSIQTARRVGQQQQRLLPDQALFQRIKACASWADCLQLLAVHGSSLDAMLISTLCTHTVYLFELQQYNLSGPTASTAMQQAAPPAPHSSSEPCPAGSNISSSQTHHSSSRASTATRSVGSKAEQSQYMQQLSALALRVASSGTFWGQQYSNVLWCFARCGCKLTPLWVQQYLKQAQQDLQQFQPRDLAQLIWAAAVLKSQPPSSFTAAFLAASGASMQRFKAVDLANTLWGLATLGVQPPVLWLNAACAVSGRRWSRFKPFELSITVWAFAKLGACFSGHGTWDIQQQQQQQEEQQQASTAAATAAGTLEGTEFGWLLGSIPLLVPAMGLQEIANLLWGLAVGGAALTQQQTQALGDQAFIILAQSMSHGKGFTASFSISLWALARLSWSPTLPQAQMLVRLLAHTLSSDSLNLRHAAILVFSLGHLKLRPPQPMMQHLMDRLAAGLEGAGLSEVLQVLTGCRCLGWRISKSWWAQLYRNGFGALQQGNAAELVLLLSRIASFRPIKPSPEWWEVYWDSMGVEIEATITARGLYRVASRRKLPHGNITRAAAPLKAAVKRRRRHLQVMAQLQHQGPQQSSGRNRSSSSSSRSRQWQPHPLSWLAMSESLQIVTNLQGVVQQEPCGGVGVTSVRAAVLLWASARLKRMPPKVLLWQLLLLVLVDVHSLPSTYLSMALWSVAHLLHRFGQDQVQCFRVVQPLAHVALWRLLVGCSGGSSQERRFLAGALHYLGTENPQLLSLRMLKRQTREAAGCSFRLMEVFVDV